MAPKLPLMYLAYVSLQYACSNTRTPSKICRRCVLSAQFALCRYAPGHSIEKNVTDFNMQGFTYQLRACPSQTLSGLSWRHFVECTSNLQAHQHQVGVVILSGASTAAITYNLKFSLRCILDGRQLRHLSLLHQKKLCSPALLSQSLKS